MDVESSHVAIEVGIRMLRAAASPFCPSVWAPTDCQAVQPCALTIATTKLTGIMPNWICFRTNVKKKKQTT